MLVRSKSSQVSMYNRTEFVLNKLSFYYWGFKSKTCKHYNYLQSIFYQKLFTKDIKNASREAWIEKSKFLLREIGEAQALGVGLQNC